MILARLSAETERRFIMNRKILAVVSILLAMAMLFALTGCDTTEEEETTTETTIAIKTPDLPTEQLTKIEDDSSVYFVDAEGNTLDDTTVLDEAGIAAKNARLLEYYNVNANAIKDGKTKAVVTRSESKSIGKQTDAEGNSVDMSENANVNAAIETLKNYMLITADESKTEYTADLKDALPGADYVNNLTAADIESSTCVDGETTRTITLTLKSPVPAEKIEQNFDMENIEDVYAEFDKASDYMTINKEATTLTYTNCVITVVASLETDEILSISYSKGINVDTEVTCAGSLEAVGTLPVHFLYTYTVNYNIDRADPAATAVAE